MSNDYITDSQAYLEPLTAFAPVVDIIKLFLEEKDLPFSWNCKNKPCEKE